MKAWSLVLLLLVPMALAHGEAENAVLAPGTYVDHGKAVGGFLAPDETRTLQLAFGGTPFWQGWLWAVYGTTDGTLEMAMADHDNATVRGWTWEPGTMRLEVGPFPVQDLYHLVLHNPTDAPLRYDLSYDQTCDCRLKAVPYDGGYSWTNVPLEAGQVADFSVEVMALQAEGADASTGHTLHATLLRADAPDPAFPDGVTVLKQWSTDGRYWNTTYKADRADTYYVLMQVTSDAPEAGPWRFLLFPSVEVDDGSALTPGFPAVFVAAALAVGLLRRR